MDRESSASLLVLTEFGSSDFNAETATVDVLVEVRKGFLFIGGVGMRAGATDLEDLGHQSAIRTGLVVDPDTEFELARIFETRDLGEIDTIEMVRHVPFSIDGVDLWCCFHSFYVKVAFLFKA